MTGEGLTFLQDINETKSGVPRLKVRPLGSQPNSLTTSTLLESVSKLIPSPNLSLSYSLISSFYQASLHISGSLTFSL